MDVKTVDRLDIAGLADGSRHAFDLTIVPLGDGSVLRVPVKVIAGRGARPHLLAIAGIHGDEPEGMLALIDLWHELSPEQVTGRLVMVPVANPTAFAAGQRRSPLDGLDLNRTFPGKPDGSPSEQLAERLYTRLAANADFVFSLHSWLATGTVVPFVEVWDEDGPVAQAGRRAAFASGFELIQPIHWPAGLLVRIANETGIPAIEAEIGDMGTSQPENRAAYHDHLIALMQHLGMLAGTPQAHPKARLVAACHVLAPVGGMMRLRVALGEWTEEGDVLATLHDLHGELVADIRAPTEGLVAVHRTFVLVRPGDHLFALFRDRTLLA